MPDGPFTFARRTLDPGLFSDRAGPMQAFYTDTVGLPLLERLQHDESYAEIFFELPEGKLKIQASTEPMEPARSGYRELLIARDVAAPQTLHDPDGLTVHVVPPGHRGVTNVGVVCAVSDVDEQTEFLAAGMGGTPHEGGIRVADTQIFLVHDPDLQPATPPMRRGFTYITLVVHEAERCRHALIAAGATDSLRLLRLDDRCLFAWLRDPHGNWIEIVQYAHLSGELPDIDRIADNWDEVILWRETAATRPAA
jgi:catechol 2,3-dioxygenase-like lactoylglutathione lyase family enzyme